MWTQTYPTGLALKNVYNGDGYLTQVVNAGNPATVYWTAGTMDAQGHLTKQTYGNGVDTLQVFDPATGRLTNQYAGAGNAVQNMGYSYDTLGNVQTRTDTNANLSETYYYDALNRIQTATAMSGAVNTTTSYAYDAIGNIICKSDISDCSNTAPNYSYNASGADSVRPHAVTGITGTINGVTNPSFTYDANGNMKSGAGRTISWTSFNMVQRIQTTTQDDTFLYSPEHERSKETQKDGTITVWLNPRYDTGLHFQKKVQPNGAIEYTSFLYAGDIQFGEVEQFATTAAPNTYTQTRTRYFHKDSLGSIVAITDESGTVLERLSYDVFGKRRSPNGTADPNGLLTSAITEHGYTGHEMMDEVDLINMNGRVYDPLMGRFASADPTVQAPENLQSYNRYSYVWNNPLAGVDPSGFEGDMLPQVDVIASPIYDNPSYGGSSGGGYTPGFYIPNPYAFNHNPIYIPPKPVTPSSRYSRVFNSNNLWITSNPDMIFGVFEVPGWNSGDTTQYLFNDMMHQKQAHTLENPDSYNDGKHSYVNAKGNAECVDFIKQTMGAPVTRNWEAGEAINSSTTFQRGTAIGTFVDGKYSGHAAVALEVNNAGIVVLDQWKSSPIVSKRTIYFDNNRSFVNNGNNYSVIKW